MTVKAVDISGMGGGYEDCCQKMLTAGMRYLSEHIFDSWAKSYKQYKHIMGICSAESEEAKKLDEAIINGALDCTGAMHQAVVNHLFWIHTNSYPAYLEKHAKRVIEIIDPDLLRKGFFAKDK